MNALHAYPSLTTRRAAVAAALCVAATLALAQAGRPHDAASPAQTTATAADETDGESEARFQEAMLAYERNHWSLAFLLLSALADSGHPESARIALQMWRHGPRLYRSEFNVGTRQIERWTLVWACSDDATPVACRRGLQARQSP
jgi:hypothetical protein